jgi:hypothetical protein
MALVDAGELVKNTSRKNSFHRPHFSKTWLVDSSIAAQWDESEVNRQADEEGSSTLLMPCPLDASSQTVYLFPD